MADYHEYPKWVTPPEGKPFIVHNASEEETALAGFAVVREEDERVRLGKVADVKGVKLDKRWAIEKMRQTITDAGHDPDLNPDA